MENKSPFTANEHYLGDYREKFLNSYRGAERREVVVRESHPHISGLDTESVRNVGYTPRDPYEPALHHMASARAYFQGLH